MGNQAPAANGNVNKHTKNRSSIIHSAKFYVPPTPTTPTSASFDSSCDDLKENLPDELKAYTNSIQTVYYFWCSEIESLSEEQYKEATVLFYMELFRRIPSARRLFTKNIELQAKQMFGMLRWMIANLSQPENAERLVSKIRMLGAIHQKMNIKPEWYTIFLDAFHDTMRETVMDKYSARVRFSLDEIFCTVSNIMQGLDFRTLACSKMGNIIKSVSNLEECLNDKEASAYLELWMREAFCVEIFLFLQDLRIYKRCSDLQRKRVGEKILKMYIDQFSQCEINVSYGAKQAIYARLKENKNVWELDLFDECEKDAKELIQTNVWTPFKKCIMTLSTKDNAKKTKPPLMVLSSTSTEYSVSAVTVSTTTSHQ